MGNLATALASSTPMPAAAQDSTAEPSATAETAEAAAPTVAVVAEATAAPSTGVKIAPEL